MGYKASFIKIILFILGILIMLAGLYHLEKSKYPTNLQTAGTKLQNEYAERKAILNNSIILKAGDNRTDNPQTRAADDSSKTDINTGKFLVSGLRKN